jgi:hypothetical protein
MSESPGRQPAAEVPPSGSVAESAEAVLVVYGRYSFGGGDVGRSPGAARPPKVMVAIEDSPAPMPLARKDRIAPSTCHSPEWARG